MLRSKESHCSFVLLAFMIATAASAGTAAAAGEKPDFSGTWIFNAEKSRLQVPAMLESAVFTIDHKEPVFRFSRVFVVRGREDALSYELTTDGREKVEKLADRTITSKLHWEDNVLVLQNRIVLLDGREAINTVRYRLLNDGRMFVAEEEFRGPIRKHDNLWVADLKPPPKDPDKGSPVRSQMPED